MCKDKCNEKCYIYNDNRCCSKCVERYICRFNCLKYEEYL